MNFSIKALSAAAAASMFLAGQSQAVLVIAGVTDGDLTGGNPKAVIIQAAAPVADLSLWGLGSANNGGGSDGQEFTFPAGSADTGDTFVITGNTDSQNFFLNNFVQNFTTYLSAGGAGAGNVNGDDAIELFFNGAAFDTFGDINVDGTGQPWEYSDGFASRIGAGVGAFDPANYSINDDAFDGLTEQQHIDIFVSAGFTAIPEPSSSLFLGLGLLACLRRRR